MCQVVANGANLKTTANQARKKKANKMASRWVGALVPKEKRNKGSLKARLAHSVGEVGYVGEEDDGSSGSSGGKGGPGMAEPEPSTVDTAREAAIASQLHTYLAQVGTSKLKGVVLKRIINQAMYPTGGSSRSSASPPPPKPARMVFTAPTPLATAGAAEQQPGESDWGYAPSVRRSPSPSRSSLSDCSSAPSRSSLSVESDRLPWPREVAGAPSAPVIHSHAHADPARAETTVTVDDRRFMI